MKACFFALIGLIDKVLNKRLRVAVLFAKGLQSLGTLAIALMGFTVWLLCL